MDEKNGAAPVLTAPIGAEQVRKLTQILQKYKAGKAQTEARILSTENWWKLRNSSEEARDSHTMAEHGFKSRSGWLHNVITSKHADARDAYPEPNIRPREAGDRAEALKLKSIVPCILDQNDFEDVYSAVQWQKLKTGTGVYKIVWDASKLNGMGDVSISRVNLLNLYWEPGVEDIQESRYFFHTELKDIEVLEEQYPELKDKIRTTGFLSTRFLYDDSVSTEGKTTVIDCYYHRYRGSVKTLQYVKYVGDTVIYATENDPQTALRGLYDHGEYPYVFDVLYPIEGSPCGYGFVDLCKNPQTEIDLLNTSFVKNAMAGATPRYFKRTDGGINEEEFLDLTKSIVNVNGNLGEDSIRQINFSPLDSIYVNLLDRVIQELRETSGNTETSTGNASSGVTAASAIAALQEASGKGSRDANKTSYRAYDELVYVVIELIRQFYDLPRQFRIVGQYGADKFISYNNAGIRPQEQTDLYGNVSFRKPEFDITCEAQKKNAYTKVAQNELALQFFQLGFFDPQMTDQALMCLDLMDFDGKDTVMQKISEQGTMFQKLVQYMQLSLEFARVAAPEMVRGLSADIMQTMGAEPQRAGEELAALPRDGTAEAEHPNVQKARAQSDGASQPDGGQVIGRSARA